MIRNAERPLWFAMLIAYSTVATAQENPVLDQIAALLETVTEQQKQLDAQKQQLEQQEALIRQLQDEVRQDSGPEKVAESEHRPVDAPEVAMELSA